MTAVIHWTGTIDCVIERVITFAMTAEYTGAAVRKNHAGRPSRPSAVWCNLSRSEKTRQGSQEVNNMEMPTSRFPDCPQPGCASG